MSRELFSKHTAMRKIIPISILFVSIFVGALLINTLKPTATEFVNNSKTTLYYKLGETDQITYPDVFVKREYEEGYEYSDLERNLIYGFTRLKGDDYSAVCSYIYVSKKDQNDPGVLFDIYIGESIRVEKNDTLKTEKRSVFDYLEEHGFKENTVLDYKDSYVEYIEGNRCHWHCYKKDNVDINVLVDQQDNSELRAFEIILTSQE